MNGPFNTSNSRPEAELLAPTLLPGDDAAAFEALRHALRRELKPETPYEGLLVDKIVRLE
jgi:hypothetical protein